MFGTILFLVPTQSRHSVLATSSLVSVPGSSREFLDVIKKLTFSAVDYMNFPFFNSIIIWETHLENGLGLEGDLMHS